MRHDKRTPEQRWKLHWIRFYKLLSCIAFTAVMIPAFESLTVWGTRQYSSVIAVIFVPLLMAVGYGIHYLLLLIFTRKLLGSTEIDFSFENKRHPYPVTITVFSCLISAVVSALIGMGFCRILVMLLGNEANTELGIPIFWIGGILVGIQGTLLVPQHFNRVCSLRNMLESLAAFTTVFAFHMWWGNGVNLLFAVCATVYALCLFLLMNQEYVIKPSYFFSTCYAPRDLRVSGLGIVGRLWMTALLLTFPLLACVSIPVTVLRYFMFLDPVDILAFPIIDAPEINALFFLLGLLLLIGASIVFIARLNGADLRRWGQSLLRTLWRWAAYAGQLVRGLWHFLGSQKCFRKPSKIKEVVAEAPHTRHYVDTVTRTRTADVSTTCTGYREFRRHFKALSTPDQQYCYAYRVLIHHLMSTHVGIKPHHTPTEMTVIIRERTNIYDMDALAHTFSGILYGEDVHASTEQLTRICHILETRLDT